MTIDKSLKTRKGIVRSRNVLTRAEQIMKLQEMDRWTDETSPLGLPKVRVYKAMVRKKSKKKKEGEEEAAATPAAAPKKAAKAAAKK
ncbi:MAG: small basic protein [Planctomycetaceae bacterium]|nr:small basic protein [Planctomycetaceae bacterium]